MIFVKQKSIEEHPHNVGVRGMDSAFARHFGEKAVEIARYCFKCDADHDPGFWKYVCDDVSFIGPLPGMDAVFGIDNYREAIADDLEFWFDYHDENYFLLYSDGNIALVTGHLVLKSRDDEKVFLCAKQRFTMLFINENDNPKLYHVHISDPDNIGGDEEFPFQVGRELRNILDNMRDNAYKDSMTGLYNRNYLEDNYDELNQEISFSASNGIGLILYLDLNGFKEVNDTLGHAAGDSLIRIFAHSLNWAAQRKLTKAIVMRAGGDEFIVVAPYNEIKSLNGLLRLLKQELSNRVPSNFPEISFSAGFTKVKEQRSLKEMISIADQNMYRCKRRLKNRRNHSH